ncbi:MAG: ATP synthase F1 subunit delta [Thermodesulfovibrionales bacterium]
MKHSKDAKRYARMFLGAVGPEAAAKALEELATVASLMERSGDFRSLLVSPQFTSQERRATLEALGVRLGFSATTAKFLDFLSEAGAAGALGEVLDKAVALYLESRRRVKATVISPIPVDSRYESRLKESLARITRRDVDIEYETDPSLLGGILVRVGSTMYDGSVKGQLRLLKDELIKG